MALREAINDANSFGAPSFTSDPRKLWSPVWTHKCVRGCMTCRRRCVLPQPGRRRAAEGVDNAKSPTLLTCEVCGVAPPCELVESRAHANLCMLSTTDAPPLDND